MNTDKPREVRSRQDLAEFVRRLRDDLKNHPEEWENRDLDRFLEAMSAWVDDMEGYFANQGEPVPSRPEWHTLAEILVAAKRYE